MLSSTGAFPRNETSISTKTRGPISCLKLLEQLQAAPIPIRKAEKIKFKGVEGRDVYNPTAPFQIKVNGKQQTVIAARVEPRDKESSKVLFFKEAGDHWSPISGGPELNLQDPFVTRIGSEVIFGGVQTFSKPNGETGHRTIFYRMQDLAKLKQRNARPFAAGPDGMKGIRLLSLPDGRILVSTRPQGGENDRGRIGFLIINRLEDLTPEKILTAKILTDLFVPLEWGGVNEMHLLKDGRVGILGHIAGYDEQNIQYIDGYQVRHYYPITFAFDPRTGAYTKPKILFQHSDLIRFGLTLEKKRGDLFKVFYSGGLIRKSDGTAVLWGGGNDAVSEKVNLGIDPLLEYERTDSSPK